jgi:hypothetical protein
VRFAARAEPAGFGYASISISDHFHPWIDVQGQSPFSAACSVGSRGPGPVPRGHAAQVVNPKSRTAYKAGLHSFQLHSTGYHAAAPVRLVAGHRGLVDLDLQRQMLPQD